MGFTKVDNRILEKLITSDLTKRQIKIILLILRLSSGCQKSYALLERKDFKVAGIDRRHVKREIEKICSLKILNFDSERKIYWINDANEWNVEAKDMSKVVRKNLNFSHLGRILSKKCERGFTKNVTNDCLKVLSEKERGKSKENNEKKKEKEKEKIISFFISEYFRRISPLSEEEIEIFSELLKRYGERAVMRAISIVERGKERSFSYFQKVLTGFDNKRMPGIEGLKDILERYELQERLHQGN